jgi:RNA-binding protein
MLTPKQRKHLESLAHALEPTVRIGKNGITPELIASLRTNLEANELVKIKILENSPITREEAADQISEQASCEIVRIIGRVLVVYRPGEHGKKGRIELPAGKSAKTVKGPSIH